MTTGGQNVSVVITFTVAMRPLQLSDHVVQTGEQMTPWDMLNKENSNMVALFNMSQCVACSPVWNLYHEIAQLQRAHLTLINSFYKFQIFVMHFSTEAALLFFPQYSKSFKHYREDSQRHTY